MSEMSVFETVILTGVFVGAVYYMWRHIKKALWFKGGACGDDGGGCGNDGGGCGCCDS